MSRFEIYEEYPDDDNEIDDFYDMFKTPKAKSFIKISMIILGVEMLSLLAVLIWKIYS